MSSAKVRAARVKVYPPPNGTRADEKIHVYVYDVFHETFLPGKSFDNLERATQFQRHEQEHIYMVQEAEPELFDLPFLSTDPDLIARVARDAEYARVLRRDLAGDARARRRKH
jgi:hypothetical protein